MPPQKLIQQVARWQLARQKQFRSIPKSGISVNYLGKKIIVLRDVFIPFMDSHPLVENFCINDGDEVLDVGTGCGNIAIFAAYQGAKKIVAIDINPNAIETTQVNVNLHKFSKIIEVRQSDVFSSINKNELFDVIVANLPIRNKKSQNLIEASMWDTNLQTNKKFITGARQYLTKNGRLYLAQANFGAFKEILILANKIGFKTKLVGQKQKSSGEIFYAFEMSI